MRRRFSSTMAAALLVAAAVALPCGAWYFAGSRDARQEAARLAVAPRQEAQKTAVRLAEHLAIRLEALLEVEDPRPFFHYQTHFHDPLSDCECSSVTVSPLAQGPTDPMVESYFQIDPAKELTLPTLGAAAQRDHGAAWLAEQAERLRTLRAAAPRLYGLLRASSSPAASDTATGEPLLPVGGECREEPVDFASWTHNMALQNGDEPAAHARAGYLPAGGAEGSVVVEVGTLLWRTVELDSIPTLTALREVITPAGLFVQGFTISNRTVEGLLRGEIFPATWAPGPAVDATEAAVVLDGADWHVRVEAAGAIEAGGEASRRVVGRFRRVFAVGTLAAILAGAGVVGLVHQAEQLGRERARFAAAAAHELRTPLAGLRMYGEMLADGLGNPDHARDYARRIATEADRLGRVVENVMGYTRLERGEHALRPAPGPLGAAVRTAVEALRPSVERAGATLVVTEAPGLPEALFDRDAVVQIVHNLVDNAEKYSRDSADRTIAVAIAPHPRGVALSVSDRGPGIPAAARGRIYEPFVRGEADRAAPGLGLGLTLVRQLARAQGATVECRDGEPNGAVFTLVFPAA